MNCSTCGSQLPVGAAICPTCGTVASYYVPGSMPAAQPTSPATPYSPPQQMPSTSYGPPPYEALQQNPYASSPYSIPQPVPTPPPPAPRRRGPAIGIIIGIGSLVFVLLAGGIFALLVRNSPANPSHVGATPTSANTTPASTTSSSATNPYSPGTGTLVINDPMMDNSRGYKWDEGSIANGGTCGFSGGAYHVHSSQKNGFICVPEASNLFLSNLAFEVKVTITQGTEAGIVVRLDQTTGTGYYFSIESQGSFVLCKDDCSQAHTLSSGSNGAINKGLNQTNLLAIVANGNTISVYVNGQFIASGNDSAHTRGQIGIVAGADVVATNARVWSL